MFLAFAHRKIGRWNEDEQNALTLESEDALTAMILGRLRYLPIAMAWDLLVGSADVLRGIRPSVPEVASMHFWPRWQLGSREVEPDAVWETDKGMLVVEAKWKGTQDAAQIDREYAAGVERYPQGRVSVLALGGVRSEGATRLQAESTAENLLWRSWRGLSESARARLKSEPVGPVHAVLSDIVEILRWRGLRAIDELQEFASLPSFSLRDGFAWEPVTRTRQLADLSEFPKLSGHSFDWKPT